MKDSRFARWLSTGVAIAAALTASIEARAQEQGSTCGPLTNHYGPFDYRTHREQLKKVVEPYHFTPEVEALIRGKSSMKIGADIAYLMGASPNHHRGLVALVRLAERAKSPQPPDMPYSVDCYFDRAIRFARDDTVVRALYADYLQKQGRQAQAIQQLEVATGFAGENALSHYNIGLVYFELGQLDRALAQAHKAQSLGLVRTKLADLLRQKNAWKDPAN